MYLPSPRSLPSSHQYFTSRHSLRLAALCSRCSEGLLHCESNNDSRKMRKQMKLPGFTSSGSLGLIPLTPHWHLGALSAFRHTWQPPAGAQSTCHWAGIENELLLTPCASWEAITVLTLSCHALVAFPSLSHRRVKARSPTSSGSAGQSARGSHLKYTP